MSNALVSLFWFVVVLAAIPVALWFLKRTPIGGGLGGPGGPGPMRQIATLPLSASQRIVTVEVGSGDERRWLVLGVTAQTISTLHSMAPQAEPATPPLPTATFAQLLTRLQAKARGSHGGE